MFLKDPFPRGYENQRYCAQPQPSQVAASQPSSIEILQASLPKDCAFERDGPGVAQHGDGTVDHRASLILDAESIAADDFADLVRRHLVLSRSIENAGKVRGGDGYDRASAALAEEGGLGRAIFFEFCGYAQPVRGEAGLGQGDSQPAVGNVVGGLEAAFGGEGDEAVDEALFGIKVDGGWFAGDNVADRF